MEIPEHFKRNLELDILVFYQQVKVNYRFWWPEKNSDGSDPMFAHVEFRSYSGIISKTGYRSHFFHTEYLKETDYQSIEEFALALAEHIAEEIGYEPPTQGSQLRMF